MTRFAKWFTFCSGAAIVLLVAISALLTSLTQSGKDAAVTQLERQLAQRNIASSQPGLAPPIQTQPRAEPEKTAGDGDAESRWQRLFMLSEQRFGEDPLADDRSAAYQAMRIPLFVRWGKKAYDKLTPHDLTVLATLLDENSDMLDEIAALTQPDIPACPCHTHKKLCRFWVLDTLLSSQVLFDAANTRYDDAIQRLTSEARVSVMDPYEEFPFTTGSSNLYVIRDALSS
ncbi:MAG: hypothetical protein HZB26_19250 [Candidatus Hydrogenedentes bacterium]|nr:hypothetical protein [Candidatus Hydrogenedentota bacterium]